MLTPSEEIPPPYGTEVLRDRLSPGQVFGPWQIHRELCFGLFGALYAANHRRESADGLIFVLPRVLSAHGAFDRRILAQGEKVSQVDHPYLLPLRGCEKIEERWVVRYSHVEGRNAQDYVEPWGASQKVARDPETLPQDEVRRIGRGLAEAYQVLQRGGLHHSHLNPKHLIISDDGDVYAYGAGIVDLIPHEVYERVISVGLPPLEIDVPKNMLDTVESVSPEIRAGRAPDTQTDLYALGNVLHYLLTASLPSPHREPPSAYNPELWPGWDRVTRRCLTPERSERFQTLAQFRQALDHLEEAAEQPLKPERDPGQGRGRRRALLLGLLLVVLVAAGMWYFRGAGEDADARPTGIVAGTGAASDLQVTVHPLNATVAVTGEAEAEFALTDGRLAFNGPEGNYTLSFAAPGFQPTRRAVAHSGKPLTLDVTLEPQIVPVTLEARDGTVVEVLAGEEERPLVVGTIPQEGRLRLEERFLARPYTLRLTREHFGPVRLALDLSDGKAVTRTVEQQVLHGGLIVRTDPPGATVFVNGEARGETPLTLFDLPYGEVAGIRAELPTWRTRERFVELDPARKMELDFGVLERTAAQVVPTVRLAGEDVPEGLVDEVAWTLGDRSGRLPTLAAQRFPAGRYVLRLAHPDFFPEEVPLELADRERRPVRTTLEPRPAQVRIAVPTGVEVEVLVDGERMVPDAQGILALPGFAAYDFEVRARDHLTMRRTLDLDPREETVWDLQLVPIPGPDEGKRWYVPYLGLELAWVPEGSFRMGSEREEAMRMPNEGPRTRVTLSSGFWMGAAEVSQAIYLSLMGENPSRFENLQAPVENVTWAEAMAFCAALTEREAVAGRLPAGFVYRLPTEAEWEYAARADSTTAFSWGDTATPADGNFRGVYPRSLADEPERRASPDDEVYGPVPADAYAPNPWGLRHMHGNVREWCLDTFNSRYPGEPVTDWVRLSAGIDRVTRGGSWDDPAHRARSAARERFDAATRSGALGFRVVLGPVIEDPRPLPAMQP